MHYGPEKKALVVLYCSYTTVLLINSMRISYFSLEIMLFLQQKKVPEKR